LEGIRIFADARMQLERFNLMWPVPILFEPAGDAGQGNAVESLGDGFHHAAHLDVAWLERRRQPLGDIGPEAVSSSPLPVKTCS
jgi:hypothetical protein